MRVSICLMTGFRVRTEILAYQRQTSMSGIVRSAWNMQDRYDASCKSARFHPQTSDGSAYQGDNEYHAGLRSSFLIPSHFRTVYTRFVLNDIVLYSHHGVTLTYNQSQNGFSAPSLSNQEKWSMQAPTSIHIQTSHSTAVRAGMSVL